jgi:hypothetical protein|nr:MAG TPA: ubiquitin-binding zinc finger protein [Caudoviricetes sp.]
MITKIKQFLCGVLYHHKLKLGFDVFVVDSEGEIWFVSRCERCGKKISIKFKEASK